MTCLVLPVSQFAAESSDSWDDVDLSDTPTPWTDSDEDWDCDLDIFEDAWDDMGLDEDEPEPEQGDFWYGDEEEQPD